MDISITAARRGLNNIPTGRTSNKRAATKHRLRRLREGDLNLFLDEPYLDYSRENRGLYHLPNLFETINKSFL